MKKIFVSFAALLLLLSMCVFGLRPTMVMACTMKAPAECTYRRDGQIDTLYERNGSKVTKWIYVYDENNELMFRMQEVKPMKTLITPNSGADTYYSRYFWILDEPLENVVSFSLAYRVNDNSIGNGSLLIRTSDSYDYYSNCYDNWRDITDGEKSVIKYDGYGQYSNTKFTFDYPRDIWAFSCSRSGGVEGSGYGTAAITSAWIADYSVLY